MPTFSSPPILIWQPGGGVPPGTESNPPVYSQAGTTPLIEGQAYVDVVFGSVQTTDEWVLVECIVVNEIDGDPLNIWPGLITDKTAEGFRLQLNGMPDSGNYYLHWAVSGINITPSAATTYYLSGPATGPFEGDSTFTVALPPSTTVSGTVTVTPDDGGAGGTFAPTSVTLSTSSRSTTFTYTPVVYGAILISVTSTGGLIEPAGLSFISVVTEYDFSGPSSGASGVASTDFTVALPVGGVVVATVTVTPSDGGGGGTFTPTTVDLTVVAPSGTFTYTPASAGDKTISVTNNGGLTDPDDIVYTSIAPFDPSTITGLKLWLKADAIAGPPADGASVQVWADSSGNGNDVDQVNAGSRPLFKTNRINGLPALKFDGVNDYMERASIPGGVTTAVSVFVVQRKNANSGTLVLHSETTSATNSFAIYLPFSDNVVYFDLGDTTATGRISGAWGGNYTDFFAWSFVAGGGNMAVYRNGTSVVASGGHTNSYNPAGQSLKINGYPISFQDADIAEILIYDNALGTTDRQNVENHLRTKYGLP